ncbi:UNVERIFIED_CONTAM: Aryl hydrocarbon receptor nuclear translocator 2 [Gekko kuhli]
MSTLVCNRENFGFEDGNREERGPAVLNENVYGIEAFFHLPDEIKYFEYLRCGNAPLDHLPLNRITTMRKRYRNGLGPVKEGEAQYAVVHCTGYIKAWPPAGKCGGTAGDKEENHIELCQGMIWLTLPLGRAGELLMSLAAPADMNQNTLFCSFGV